MIPLPQRGLPSVSCSGHTISSRFSLMDTSLMLTQILAVWSTVLSTILAGVKVWEVRNNRLKVNVSALWTGSEDIGHSITIRNLSSFPVILVGWELFYRQQKFFIPQDEPIEKNVFDWSDVTINPVSVFSLDFNGQDYFSTRKTMEVNNIYIKLYFSMHKAIVRQIFKAKI